MALFENKCGRNFLLSLDFRTGQLQNSDESQGFRFLVTSFRKDSNVGLANLERRLLEDKYNPLIVA